jgi:hypothetical protein
MVWQVPAAPGHRTLSLPLTHVIDRLTDRVHGWVDELRDSIVDAYRHAGIYTGRQQTPEGGMCGREPRFISLARA